MQDIDLVTRIVEFSVIGVMLVGVSWALVWSHKTWLAERKEWQQQTAKKDEKLIHALNSLEQAIRERGT